jgi:Na+-transporting NADH:ubiquinone oxidoreductase subunit D
MKLTRTKSFKTIIRPLWETNPIHIQMLGICSALAVTVQMKTALVMALSMTFVVSTSSLLVSLLRKWIPSNIRIIVELAIISTLVIIIDEFLRAFFYDMSKQLSVFVGLIITNCIVLGRTEAFALSNPPLQSWLDGIGNGFGYGFVLILVSFFRELLGSGKIFGRQVVSQAIYGAGYEDSGFMLLAPAAFIIIGLLVWIQKSVSGRKE